MPEWGIVHNYFSVYYRAGVTFNQRGGYRFVRRISLIVSQTRPQSAQLWFPGNTPNHQNPHLVEMLPLQTMVPLTCKHLSGDVHITTSCPGTSTGRAGRTIVCQAIRLIQPPEIVSSAALTTCTEQDWLGQIGKEKRIA